MGMGENGVKCARAGAGKQTSACNFLTNQNFPVLYYLMSKGNVKYYWNRK